MRVKYLQELYTWKQIRKLELIHRFDVVNGTVPIRIYVPHGAGEAHHLYQEGYQWKGTQRAYYAKRLWEAVRKQLMALEPEALAFDIVEASECFNTIRFRNQEKACHYCDEFKRLLQQTAASKILKSAIGKAPVRPHPYDSSQTYQEIIYQDLDHKEILPYSECEPPDWDEIKDCFVELTESELAYLMGEDVINKPMTDLDKELDHACGALDFKRAEALLQAGANPNCGSRFGGTLLSTVILDWPSWSSEIIEKSPDDIYAMVDLLLKYGADINFCPFCGTCALYDAVHTTREITAFLLTRGADPNQVSWIAPGERFRTAFEHASDDACAYRGEEGCEEYEAIYDLLKAHGGKYFEELVPDFYEE